MKNIMKDESFTLSWKIVALSLIALDAGIVLGVAAKSIAADRYKADFAVAQNEPEPTTSPKETTAYLLSCKEDAKSFDYVSDERVQQLLNESIKDSKSIYNRSLTAGEKSVIIGSIDTGPKNAFYSARIMRSYSIAEGLDEQVNCLRNGSGACPIPAYIEQFSKSVSTGQPMTPSEWTEKRDEWIGFLKKDIQSGSHCLGS